MTTEYDIKMENLAEELGLEYDGSEDTRLFYPEMVSWFIVDESRYNEIEHDIMHFEIEKDKYAIYTFCDSSGYDYWVNNMREANYVSVYAHIKDTELNEQEKEELQDAIEKVYLDFLDYYDESDWEELNDTTN